MALSRDNIIIIAVFSGAGALVVLAVAARFLARRTVVSNPLPPVQPLAHHREQQLTQLPRAHTWYSHSALPAPQPFASITPRGSRASLLAKNPSFASYTDESASSSPGEPSHSLPLPIPLFHPTRAASATSLTSSDQSSHVEPHALSSFPSTPIRRSSRPMSTISSHSIIYSKPPSRHNTIRGTPHSRHTQIQIVLPTPLSPELPSPDLRGLTRTPDLSRRSSVVDQWVSGTAHADGPPSSASNLIIKPSPRRAVSEAFLGRGEGVYMVAE